MLMLDSNTYPIVLGSPSEEDLRTFRYDHALPVSVDETAPCVARFDEGTHKVSVERPQRQGFQQGDARFTGTSSTPGADYALVFRGDHYTLEKIDRSVNNLRHVVVDDNQKETSRAPKRKRRPTPKTSATTAAVPTLERISAVSRKDSGT